MSAEQINDEGAARNYAAFMRCDAGEHWMADVEKRLTSWLHEKNIDLDLKDNDELTFDTVYVKVGRFDGDRARDLRLDLVERQPGTGTWTTEVLAHDESGAQNWLHITVANDEGRFVSVPRVARYLMRVLPLGDSFIVFADHPQIYRTEDVNALRELLTDQDRHGLVFVAGTSDADKIPLDSFVNMVGRWTGEVYGLAQVVVLDPAATQKFERVMENGLSVRPWTIRTYRPGVDTANMTDARRHRTMGTTTPR